MFYKTSPSILFATTVEFDYTSLPHIIMDYTWGVPVAQSAMPDAYAAQFQQYQAQAFTGYEPSPYFMGYPWSMGSYAPPMYPYMAAGYHQMPYHTKGGEVFEQPPAAKRARIEIRDDLTNDKDVDADLGNETTISERCPSPNLELSQNTSLVGPMTSTLANPLPPLTIDVDPLADTHEVTSPPVSPIPQMNESTSHMNHTYSTTSLMNDTCSINEYKSVSFPSQQYIHEEPIAPEPGFQASQVMVVLPNGTQSSLWDQQVPAAFAAYQHPAAYAAAPGPTRRRRSSRGSNQSGKAKNNHCNLCDKSYESSYKLKLHMNAHTGERPFVCEFCGKGFARGPNLNAHRRVHTGEKPFVCKRCNRGFSHPSDRIVHMVREVCTRADRYIRRTGQGWECVSCESGGFESRDQAERHARQHETGKGLSCPVCSMNYQGEKANVLVKHVRQCHPEYMESLN